MHSEPHNLDPDPKLLETLDPDPQLSQTINLILFSLLWILSGAVRGNKSPSVVLLQLFLLFFSRGNTLCTH
jgi:hypothetical protein